MKRFFFFLLACSACLGRTGYAQKVGTWRSYLAYAQTTSVAEANNRVYALADGSLYSYGKDDNSLRYYSKETGLSDIQLNCIAFNSQANILVAAYANGNIDLVGEDNSVYNLPFLLNSTQIQDKTIFSVYNHQEMAYLSTAFGVVAVNAGKKEIKETYRLNAPVSAVCILGGDIYALTSPILRKASLSDNLLDPASWREYPVGVAPGAGQDTVLQVCAFQNTLCFLLKNKGVYYQSGNGLQELLPQPAIRNIKEENGRLIAFSSSELFIYASFTERDRGSLAGIADVSSLKNNNTFWLATGEKGLSAIRRTNPNQYEMFFSNAVQEGPKRNLAAFLKMHKGKLYVAGGGRWADRFNNPGTVMIYDTDSLKWNNLKDVSGFRDATCIAVDPQDETHLFVSTWGEGVYEFKDGELVQRYNHANSALNSALPNTPSQGNYVRVEGVCFDADNNLWMTNAEVSDIIVVRKAGGTWTKLRYDDISHAILTDKILIASNGHKWVNLVRAGKSGIFVFDDRGTIDNTSDDVFHYYSTLSDTQNIGANEFLCITEDRRGQIWIGTNRGVFIVSTPSRAVEGTMTGSRIIHTGSDGNPTYFLADERVNAIAVDGGNRKWLGTAGSGLYLVSDDGKEILSHFTTANSPLLSNTIQSLAIDDRSGEVFIGTDKGLISYIGEAIRGSDDYANVYAFPNPVRPESDDRVVITGLMENSNVKITDARGTLLFEGRSTGGQFTWNCRNRHNAPVATGVYLVLSSTPEGRESVVTKIAVVR
jgi:hypothetical protein